MAAYSPSMNPSKKAGKKEDVHYVFADESKAPMMALEWYHPNLTRHAADCMLIDNAPEGSYRHGLVWACLSGRGMGMV